MCSFFCQQIDNSSFIKNLQQNSKYFNKADYYEGVYRALTAVVPYYNLLEQKHQVCLI